MYRIADYGAMIADEVRMGAFIRALRSAIKSGATVIDIGTGTGIFALLACRFGARRVYAIESDDTIQVAREIAAASECADRIEFIHATSTDVTLPERGDVVVSDLGGRLPWFRRHIPTIVDARRRFLAPGGALIPQHDVGWAAVVELPDLYAQWTSPWENDGFGLDMTAARRMVVNTTWHTRRVTRDEILTKPERWATLDYSVVEDPDVHATVTWTVTRAGTGHGFAAGFDRTLSDDISLSNAPDAADTIQPVAYRTVIFPWPAPVALEVGDVVVVDLDARLIRRDYIWTWKTRVSSPGRSDTEKANFTQSTFFAIPFSPATLHKGAESYTPALTEDGRIARMVLESMGNAASVGEIARLVSTEFSARFRRPEDALNYVADLSRQYG
jgi:type I protein arginine methyltransferase